MTKNEYNGWYNYETWLVNLWLDNDEGSQPYWMERAQECYDESEADSTFTREENAAFALRDILKDEIEESSPCQEPGLFSDLLNAAISEVNFQDIAEHYIEEVEKEEETEEEETE